MACSTVGFLSFAAAIWRCVRWKRSPVLNAPLDASGLSLDSHWVDMTVTDVARRMVWNEFSHAGQPARTLKGTYSTEFLKAVDAKRSQIIRTCCIRRSFSPDFCDFCRRNFPDAQGKDLSRMIYAYGLFVENRIPDSLCRLLEASSEVTPAEFFQAKDRQTGDVVGAYVIHNKTKDMYYVGQAKRLFFRVNQHFTGHGNGDVFSDYKLGDEFSIRFIKLTDSGYSDIDCLEKDLISKYDAYNSGYNKNSGNG